MYDACSAICGNNAVHILGILPYQAMYTLKSGGNHQHNPVAIYGRQHHAVQKGKDTHTHTHTHTLIITANTANLGAYENYYRENATCTLFVIIQI